MEELNMTDKEKMINITKGAFIKYRIAYNDRSVKLSDLEFAYNKYFFYMRMLEGVYPELNREELELEWESEIGE